MLAHDVHPREHWWQRFWRVDPWLTSIVVILLAGSINILYSAGGMALVINQGARIAMALVVLVTMLMIPSPWLIRLAPVAYVGNIALLVLVLFIGVSAGGAQRWIDLGPLRLQPSEFAKISVPMMVAWWLTRQYRAPDMLDTIIAVILIAIPVLLIRAEPDLGTAILAGVSGLVALFLAGLSWYLIIIGGVLVGIGVPLFWMFGIADYQRERVLTLFNPESDPWGSGYHIIQSKIAIGSGGISGKGYMQGTQSQLEFLPESTTDFVFAVLAEERGLFGVSILLLLYLLLVLRGLYLSASLTKRYARILCASFFFIVFINVFINIGMVSGFLPVVGLPLLFISYGGSALLAFMAALGMSLNLLRSYQPMAEEEHL